MARERRNVSSPLRAPNVANASAHRLRASTCGHSSSHLSAVRPVRRRRSCATIASCHAARRADSDAASDVPMPEPSITYGFISDALLVFVGDQPSPLPGFQPLKVVRRTLLALAGDAPGHCLPGAKIDQSEKSSRDPPAGGSGGVSAL